MRELDDDLLARFLADEATAGERAQVAQWAASDPTHAAELDQLRAVWADRPVPRSWDVDAAWLRLQSRLGEPGYGPPKVIPFERPRRSWMPYAAAAVIVIGAFGLLARTPVGPTVIATEVGIQQTVDLPDGSQVILAPATRIEYSADFGRTDREVRLEGRALFRVEHDEARPFRVRTRDAMVEDLGTEFEVLAPAAGAIQVAVVEGAVSVKPARAGDSVIMLGPRDVVRLAYDGQSALRHEAPVDEMVRWREGTLKFDETPLGEMLGELSRWFRTEFKLGDPGQSERRMNVTFETRDFEGALAILETMNMHVERTESSVMVTPRPQ